MTEEPIANEHDVHTRPRRRVGLRSRARDVRALLAWPAMLTLALLLLAAWRMGSGGDDAPAPRAGEPASTVSRSAGDASIDVPRGWVALDKGRDHVTWGTADRTHTVTLAQTEASVLPLPGVVAAVTAEAAATLPGARVMDGPVAVQLDTRAARGDSAMLSQFVITRDDGASLKVAQMWRRDARAGLDLVATWTSSDGHWPLPPRSAIPRGRASR